MEKLSGLDFIVQYVSGENVLSRLYEFGVPGTVRASSEYVDHDPLRTDAPGGSDTSSPAVLSTPVLVGQVMATAPHRSNRLANRPVASVDTSSVHSSCPQTSEGPTCTFTLPGGSVSSTKWRDRRPPTEGCASAS